MNERVGRWGQVRIYTGKFYRIFLHEKGWKFIAFAVIIAVLLSVVMGDKMFVEKEFTRTGMFAIVTAMIWVGVFNSIQNICREREIIKREHRTGLHISAYVAAHMIFQAALCAVQAVLMLVIFGFFMELPSEGVVTGSYYIDAFICFFLVLYAADMMGLAVSSVVKSTTTAMTVPSDHPAYFFRIHISADRTRTESFRAHHQQMGTACAVYRGESERDTVSCAGTGTGRTEAV